MFCHAGTQGSLQTLFVYTQIVGLLLMALTVVFRELHELPAAINWPLLGSSVLECSSILFVLDWLVPSCIRCLIAMFSGIMETRGLALSVRVQIRSCRDGNSSNKIEYSSKFVVPLHILMIKLLGKRSMQAAFI